MYKILIVDDEVMIRTGIQNAVPWRDLEIGEVKTAAGGEEALALWDSFLPDIVLTDIRMPGMDGLELLARMKKLNPELKVIILSGFDEFIYAQSALKLGAFDYLLKTIDMNELIMVLNRAVASIKSDKKKSRQLSLSLPILKEKYLHKLIYGGNDMEELTGQLQEIGLNFNAISIILAIAEVNDNMTLKNMSDEYCQFLRLQMLDAIEEALGERANCFEGKYDELVLIYRCENNLNEDENLAKMLNQCRSFDAVIERDLNIELMIGVSSVKKGVYSIKSCYEEAKRALEYRLLVGESKVIRFEEIANLIQDNFLIGVSEEKIIISALRVGDKPKLLQTLDNIFNHIEGCKKLRIGVFHQICIDLFSIASRVLQEFESDLGTLYGQDFLYFEEIRKKKNFEEIKQWLITKLEMMIDFILNTKIIKNKKEIELARQFIDEHYYEELSLNKVAAIVHISPNYFSSIFSSEIGQSFLEYLTMLRIEKAKQLLGEKDAKAFAVGEKVGYENPQYFSRIFKKYTGLTPSEYKDYLQENSGMRQKA